MVRGYFAISFPALVPEKFYANNSLLTFLCYSALGCCFACEINRKKIVHPLYDQYLGGGREIQEDKVDHGSDFPGPCLDVDYADRDRAFALLVEREHDHRSPTVRCRVML